MIAVNEIGYTSFAKKIAVTDSPGVYYAVEDDGAKRLDTDIKVTEAGFDETVGHDVYILDLSELKEPGIYHIESEQGDRSVSFKVEPHVYKTLKNSLIKSLYYQRCGTELPRQYAGPYERGRCHGSEGTILGEDRRIPLPKGWHDAGDYGRYVSAGAVAVAHMLYAYELFPEAFGETVNIPESGNGIPDILNECRYELEFLSSMQEEDGGVHHKATSYVFCGFVMPEEDDKDIVVFPVTSMSTADFAAVMCIASRVYEEYDPAFARECIHQAYMAGQWLMSHPENTDFHNPEGSNTGEYTDPSDLDERLWAFAELVRTDHDAKNPGDRSILAASSQRETRQDRYMAHLISELDLYEKDHPHYDGRGIDDGMGWQDVSTLAAISVIFDRDNRAGADLLGRMVSLLKDRADAIVALQKTGYPLSMEKRDFIWGSNMVVTNRAAVLILAGMALEQMKKLNAGGVTGVDPVNIKVVELAYHDASKEEDKLTEDEINEINRKIVSYEEAAVNHLHYILGMNEMNLSYVTGFGENSVMDPHNRVSIADGIDKPIPGQMTGGPCICLADERIKKTADQNTPAQKCYVDDHMSYSTNEIAIYWNSSLLFTTAYFDGKTAPDHS